MGEALTEDITSSHEDHHHTSSTQQRRPKVLTAVATRRCLHIIMRVPLSVTVVIAGALLGSQCQPSSAFSGSWDWTRSETFLSATSDNLDHVQKDAGSTRRSVLKKASLIAGTLLASLLPSQASQAAVGTLPEFSNANAILQGLTVNVADQSQQDSMINFLKDAFDFRVLRQRKAGSITDTVGYICRFHCTRLNVRLSSFFCYDPLRPHKWLGFGPEQLSIPSDFIIPVSSFASYGGHASLHIRYDAQSPSVFYRTADAAPGDNIAYLQGMLLPTIESPSFVCHAVANIWQMLLVGVPTYRISQMVKNGGNVLDAYGYVNVVSPCGLPMRGIVGISPDPIMFVAINCANVEKSRAFYEQLGFVEQEYPYSRLSKGAGQFEPPQPPKSVYLAPSPNCMGVLLLQAKDKKKKIIQNPVLESLNVVYNPSQKGGVASEEMVVADPSGVAIAFQSVNKFEFEELATRVA